MGLSPSARGDDSLEHCPDSRGDCPDFRGAKMGLSPSAPVTSAEATATPPVVRPAAAIVLLCPTRVPPVAAAGPATVAPARVSRAMRPAGRTASAALVDRVRRRIRGERSRARPPVGRPTRRRPGTQNPRPRRGADRPLRPVAAQSITRVGRVGGAREPCGQKECGPVPFRVRRGQSPVNGHAVQRGSPARCGPCARREYSGRVTPAATAI